MKKNINLEYKVLKSRVHHKLHLISFSLDLGIPNGVIVRLMTKSKGIPC